MKTNAKATNDGDALARIGRALADMRDGEDVRTASRMVRDRFRELQGEAAREAAVRFRVGDKVEFNGRRGVTLSGTIVGFGPKRAKVEVPGLFGGRPVTWTVGYTLLRKAAGEEER